MLHSVRITPPRSRPLGTRLPPTTTPLPWRAWQRGIAAPADALPRFAAALADTVWLPYVWLASSGRAALRLLLDTLTDQPHLAGRREVTLPGYTCPSVAKVVLDAGLTPRLVDMDPTTLNYDPAQLADAVTLRTLAVIGVHPFGLPVDLRAARQAAQAAGALLIEDAAQSLGARTGGQMVGALGDAAIYSLGPGKPLALGGGGVLSTRAEWLAAAVAARAAMLAAPQGVGVAWTWARMGIFALAFQPRLWWLAAQLGAQRVGDQEASWGYAMTGLSAAQAAVGLALLPQLAAINEARRARGDRLNAVLASIPGLTLPTTTAPAAQPIYLRLPLLTATAAQADALARALGAAGLGRMYRRTLAEFFPQLAAGDLSGSLRVARTLCTLPTHHHVTDADLAQMPQWVAAVLAESAVV